MLKDWLQLTPTYNKQGEASVNHSDTKYEATKFKYSRVFLPYRIERTIAGKSAFCLSELVRFWL